MNCNECLTLQDLPTCWASNPKITGITVTGVASSVVWLVLTNKATRRRWMLKGTTDGGGVVEFDLSSVVPFLNHAHKFVIVLDSSMVEQDFVINGESGCCAEFNTFDNAGQATSVSTLQLTTEQCSTT